jgi:hypothetical protein
MINYFQAMSNYCFPLLEASICDTNLLLAHSLNDCVLRFKKKGQSCSIDIPAQGGEIYLTDVEILEHFDNANVFQLQLTDTAGTIIPIEYIDCEGNFNSGNSVKVTFGDCEFQNGILYENCF